MQIDERQLAELSDEVDQLHRASMRTISESRRGFLQKAAVGGGLLAAGSLVAPIGGLVPGVAAQEETPELTADQEQATFVASIELALAELYKNAAESGKLRNNIADIAMSFAGHHRDHATAAAAILGEEATTPAMNEALVDEFRSVAP